MKQTVSPTISDRTPVAFPIPPHPTLISIVGPTGSGKTDLAARLATWLGVPVISTDSRQVYRGMRIGSAQPTDEQLSANPHYFIADREPTERFSCADFEREALALLEKLFTEHKFVIAVGGSGLYIDALLKGLDTLPDVDHELRNELAGRLSSDGLKPLLDMLERLDPEYCATVDRQNPARVLRALEVCLQTGRTFSSLRSGSSLHSGAKTPRLFDTVKIGTDLPRSELYARIDARVEKMIADGLEAEARKLYPLKHLPSLQTVGYREMFACFDGEHDLDRAVELIKRNSRRYAKRQLTWFRRDTEIRWFHPSDTDSIMDHINAKHSGKNYFQVSK